MKQSLTTITNFLLINEQIATAGQPTKEQLPLIKDFGYQVVINLALRDSPNAILDEEKILTNLGLTYIHIPVIWENPKEDELFSFFSTMQQHGNHKIFIHCVLNMRVSAFLYLYRIRILKEKLEIAKADLEKIWKPDGVWLKFIEEHSH